MRRPAPSAVALAIALAAGCRRDPPPPTEKLARVTVTASPLMSKPEGKKPALDTAHTGDLLYVVGPVTEKGYEHVDWKGQLDGVEIARSGDAYQVRRSKSDRPLYALRGDFAEEVEVPDSGFLCAGIQRVAPEPRPPADGCADALRRVALPSGALAAFVPCQVGPCAVGLWRGGELRALAVEGLVEARALALPEGGGDALVAVTRFVRAGGAWTGGHVVVLGMGADGPVQKSELVLDEIDARQDEVKNRVVTFEVTPEGVHLAGAVRRVRRSDGEVLSTEPIDERHRFTRDAQMVR